MAFWSKRQTEHVISPQPQTPTESVPAESVNPLAKIDKIIAIASGKGGVGKSTVAVNLAKALEQKGARVGLLDADVMGPSVPIMLKLPTPTRMNGKLVVPPQHGNTKVMSSAMFAPQGRANIMRGPMAGNFVRQLLLQVDWGELDYLIIDYPPGTGDIQLSLSQTSPMTAAILVSTPQDIALADVGKAAQMFETLKLPVLGVVETMSWFVCDQCEKRHFIFKQGGAETFAKRLGIPLLGQIPLDPALTECSDSGEPIVTRMGNSPSAQAFYEAADKILGELSVLQEQKHDGLLSFSLTWQ
ncbi:MAG: Mrp/NBP35 family ATP-binding protein [Deltaproteobacteria bacterium]|nr:Mrp/NBP35 family ATP-binding protein [Deltaproteobacteria bacterium]